MQTLVIDQKNYSLDYSGAALLIKKNGREVRSAPLQLLERVLVAPSVELKAGVLGALNRFGVALLVVNHRYPERNASLDGPQHGDVKRRLSQYRAVECEGIRLLWATRLLIWKCDQQRRTLSQLLQERPDQRLSLSHALDTIGHCKSELMKATTADPLPLEHLLGLEGAAAAAYFSGFAPLFAPGLLFKQRQRRPAPDPVNAMLSLGYTLIQHEVVIGIKSVGLDPMLGFMHRPSYRRDSLACDLLEPFRPQIDLWVYRLFQGGTLRHEDFTYPDGAARLRQSGKGRFYAAYYAMVPEMSRKIGRVCRWGVGQLERLEADHECT